MAWVLFCNGRAKAAGDWVNAWKLLILLGLLGVGQVGYGGVVAVV